MIELAGVLLKRSAAVAAVHPLRGKGGLAHQGGQVERDHLHTPGIRGLAIRVRGGGVRGDQGAFILPLIPGSTLQLPRCER